MAEDEDERPPGEEGGDESPSIGREKSEVKESTEMVPSKNSTPPPEIIFKSDVASDPKTSEAAIGQEEKEPVTTQSADTAVPQSGAASAPVDPYAGYTGYDPAAAGYDYSAYWAHYGYHASAYSYPGMKPRCL